MVTSHLFREVLIRPAAEYRADKLLVLSGYATAGMAEHHIDSLKTLYEEKQLVNLPEVHVLVGMAMNELETVQHRAFCDLVKRFGKQFCCSYLVDSNPCHAKVYVWERAGIPIKAFLGSANYTRTGFSVVQHEAIAEVNPEVAHRYCSRLWEDSVLCSDPEVESLVPLVRSHDQKTGGNDDDFALLPLVIESGKHAGETQRRGGLNWGQRERRNPEEAYIPVPVRVRKRKFFPPRGERFTALTDDDRTLILKVAQQEGKALHTTMDNSELGRYFRKRLGVPSGEYVERAHLDAYGRTTVEFYRIDAETYYMDFRPDTMPGQDVDAFQD